MRFHGNIRFAVEERGASAAEFALVLPLFLLLILGVLHMGFLLYATSCMHSAVEVAARCASVRKTTDCTNAATTQAFAASNYSGPGIGQTFVHTVDANCGNRVTGTGNYVMTTGIYNPTVAISATACFPA